MADLNETQVIVDIDNNTYTYINPTTINSTKSSINLFGDNITDLSLALNENFIRITQNFLGTQPPINPLKGQKWLSSIDNLIYLWDGFNWKQTQPGTAYSTFLYIKYDISTTEFNIDESIFNFTVENIVLYDENMELVPFVIDQFDSKKIILKRTNIIDLYILVFHPKDKISNPFLNKKVEIITNSGETQFDIGTILSGTNISTVSVAINNVMLHHNEFSIINNVLNIDGKIYRIKENDKLVVYKYGGSLQEYNTYLNVNVDKPTNKIRIPKFFIEIDMIRFIDIKNNQTLNPINIDITQDFIEYSFFDKREIKTKAQIRVI